MSLTVKPPALNSTRRSAAFGVRTTANPPQRREALRVSFVLTSMPVGGAEVLLQNLIARFDRRLIQSEIVCLKEPGPLGEQLADSVPVTSGLLQNKWDGRVLWRLIQHFRRARTDAIVTVGAGDKMFWGRLAGRIAGVPVICSALHSTGWPDGIGWCNRKLTSITDAFIAVAEDHAQFLINWEGLPRNRVFKIPNGVDTDRFRPNHTRREWLRESLQIPASAPVVGIVAALREEKNHPQFVTAAREILATCPETHFVIVGDGPTRETIERQIAELGLNDRIHLLGTRSDTPDILAGLDVFVLTSLNEANPVSILEALACGVPVVSPNVGSIHETVIDNQTGILTKPGSASETAEAVVRLLSDPETARDLGRRGRNQVRHHWSLQAMVSGYEKLISATYNSKVAAHRRLLADSVSSTHQARLGSPMLSLPQVPVETGHSLSS